MSNKDKFGNFSILRELTDELSLAKCKCGDTVVLPTEDIKKGRIVSCGCVDQPETLGKAPTDLTGKRFGKLTAVKYIGDRKWQLICDCGEEHIAWSFHLTSKNKSRIPTMCNKCKKAMKREGK